MKLIGGPKAHALVNGRGVFWEGVAPHVAKITVMTNNNFVASIEQPMGDGDRRQAERVGK